MKFQRGDAPLAGEEQLEKGTAWFRAAQYELSLDDAVPVVKPVATITIEWYDPWRPNPPAKQPYRPEDYQWSPHTHLAHLSVESKEEVLEFYNRWGPLGLWTISIYRDRHPFTVTGIPAPRRPFGVEPLAPEIQGWFLPPDADRNALAHQEPLEFFKDAAEEYKQWLEALKRARTDPDEATRFSWKAGQVLAECRPLPWSPWRQTKDGRWINGERWALVWSFPSLLSFCYLRTVLDLIQGGLGFRQCANRRCGRFFLPGHPRQVYCSVLCHNAENVRRCRERKRSERLP